MGKIVEPLNAIFKVANFLGSEGLEFFNTVSLASSHTFYPPFTLCLS